MCVVHRPQSIVPGQRRGQIAIGFLAVMGIAVVLVMMTVNVGQMAKVRVEVSNAADAGALAGASWIASGMNEAGLVAAKIEDAITMVQVIYLVPFCPGAEQSAYARALWRSLVEHPYAEDPFRTSPGVVCPPGGGDCVPGGPGVPVFGRRRGPVPYFHEVANDAIWAAWYVGGREWYTAAVNNLMINSATSTGCTGTDWASCMADFSNEHALAPIIAQEQRRLIKSPDIEGGPPPIVWNNTLPTDDPMNLTHTAPVKVEYPEAPPQLVLDPYPADREAPFPRVEYWQFEPAHPISVPGIPDEFFDCTFEGWGIRTGYSGPGDPDAPFILMPRNLLDYTTNPLAMASGGRDVNGVWMTYWRKAWDVTWLKGRPSSLDDLPGSEPYIPSLEHLQELGDDNPSELGGLGPCKTPDGDDQYVCGIVPKPLPVLAMKPRFVMGPSNHVTVGVAHKVETATGLDHLDFGITLPHLVPRFEPVGAKAQATFFPPTLPLREPADEAKAVLDDAR